MRPTAPASLRLLATVAGLGILAAACSNNAAPTTTTTTTTSTTTTTTTSTTTTSTTSTTTTTTQAVAATCTVGQLKLVPVQGSGAAGTIYSPVEVVNISASPCSLDGRPSVSLTGAVQGGKAGPLSATVQQNGQESVFSVAPSLLTLPATGKAAVGFLVQSSDVPVDGEQACPVVSSMTVKLPGVSTPLETAETFTACGGPTISVSAIVAVGLLQAD